MWSDGSGRALKRSYAYGRGAVIGKHLRLGDRHMVPITARELVEDLWVIATAVAHLQRSGLGQVANKYRGLADALAAPVDRRTHLFRRIVVQTGGPAPAGFAASTRAQRAVGGLRLTGGERPSSVICSDPGAFRTGRFAGLTMAHRLAMDGRAPITSVPLKKSFTHDGPGVRPTHASSMWASAEGYYAVGLTVRMPAADVFAFDTDAEAQRMCRDMAERNGVSEHVHNGL